MANLTVAVNDGGIGFPRAGQRLVRSWFHKSRRRTLSLTSATSRRMCRFWYANGLLQAAGTTWEPRVCTTRPSRVVDRHCRIHRMSNIYIAGNSVLPTAGADSTTFTLVALSLSLADHIAMQLRALDASASLPGLETSRAADARGSHLQGLRVT